MPRWVLVPALGAPIVLIGGWTLAAAVQPPGYDPVRDTISALAAHGAHERLIMTVALLLLGACHLGTAVGLRVVRPRGRTVLALGGAATLAVGLFPQSTTGGSAAHAVAATIAFVALLLWPWLGSRESAVPLIRPRWAGVASGVMAVLFVLFVLELDGAQLGLAERVLAGAEALWPLAVVASVLVGQQRRRVAAGHLRG